MYDDQYQPPQYRPPQPQYRPPQYNYPPPPPPASSRSGIHKGLIGAFLVIVIAAVAAYLVLHKNNNADSGGLLNASALSDNVATTYQQNVNDAADPGTAGTVTAQCTPLPDKAREFACLITITYDDGTPSDNATHTVLVSSDGSTWQTID